MISILLTSVTGLRNCFTALGTLLGAIRIRKTSFYILRSSEKTQTTLIVVWLVEIYQNKLAALRESGGAEVGSWSTELTRVPHELGLAFSFIVGVHIGTRALHVLNLMWFG
jgi:hypothetical protein